MQQSNSKDENPHGSSAASSAASSSSSSSASASTHASESDEAINAVVSQKIWGLKVSALGTEYVDLESTALNGVVRITGSTTSAMLYRRLTVDIAEDIRKDTAGVKPVDHSAVKAP